MAATILTVLMLAVASGAVTVLIGRWMFRACRRGDGQHQGSTPVMFRAADPYLAGLVEDLYQKGEEDENPQR